MPAPLLPEFDWDDGERRTQRALELDPNDPEANRIMGSILMHRGAFDASRKYHEKAMELSPSDAYVKGRSAAFYNFSGEPERALALLDEAGELDPFLHVWCIEERVAVLYHLGRFREAIEAALRLTFQNSPITIIPRGRACGAWRDRPRTRGCRRGNR